ncbi:MAG: Ig domain-containing protein [Bacteroidales bacterium]|nr:Ig domain-containing protein [Bacteroidales bacterium]
MKKLLFYSLLSLSLFALPSCGSDKEDEPKPEPNPEPQSTIIPVSSLTLDNTSITIVEGETFTLTATVTPDNATDKTVTWTSSDATVATVSDGKVTAVKEGAATITAKAGDKTAECKVTVTAPKPVNEYVAKAFSVSETKQVYFSSGNLQYYYKNMEWRFAPLQYDCIGSGNKNISDDYDGYIDLFGWGTGNNPTLASNAPADYATFSNWGDKIKDGNEWQTLTADEWYYLIHSRENASEKYGVAEVAGVQGLILLPDGWKLPEGLSFKSGLTAFDVRGQEYYKTINNYSAEEWRKMESAGAVFLPAAGYRLGTSVDVVGDYGWYWTSSFEIFDDAVARKLYFGSFMADATYGCGRFCGCSVRLVCAAQ